MPLSIKDRKIVDDFYIAFYHEIEVFRAKLPQLLEQYPGEYVAIFKGEIVAHRPTWEDLANLTQKEYPNDFVLMEKVEPQEQVVEYMDTIEG